MAIYKNYDQTALDRQYNNRLNVPEHAFHRSQWEVWSRETEKELPVINDVPYGNLTRERLDIYPATKPNAKTLVFIHGGYWQMLDKTMFHFVAKAFPGQNITTVIINYPLAPESCMDQIVSSCREAIRWTYENIADYNGNPEEIYVAGHSAGGHLVTMLLASNPCLRNYDKTADIIKGACTISGLFNLIPIQLCYVKHIIGMDEETAVRNSSFRLSPTSQSPLIVAVGTAETDEFNDQSDTLYKKWKEKNIPVELLKLPNLNHYSILDTIIDPASMLHKGMVKLMKI
jgi:arylformamidase